MNRELSTSRIFARHFTSSLNCRAPSKPGGIKSIATTQAIETKIEIVEREKDIFFNLKFLHFDFPFLAVPLASLGSLCPGFRYRSIAFTSFRQRLRRPSQR